MQRILLLITTGALAFSFVFFPAFSYAADTFPTTCRVRSALTAAEVQDLSGDSSALEIATGKVLPTDLAATQTAAKEAFGLLCSFSLIKYITNIVFLIVFAVSVVIIAYAGFNYITAAGSEDKAKKAKSLLIGATIGIAVAVLARLIPAIVKGFLGG